MAYTTIADVINPEVLADQISAKYPDMLVLGNSSLVEVDSTFPLGSPGTQFKLPFWKRIPAFGAMTEGTALVPGAILAAAEFAIVQRAGGAYEVYDTAQLVSKADPVQEIASQVARRAAEYIDGQLTLEVQKTPNVFLQNGSKKTNTAGTMDQNAVILSLVSTLGDNYGKIIQGGALIVHSKVFGDLLQTGAIQNQYQSGMDVIRTGVIPTIIGLPIIVSDLVTVNVVSSVNQYQSYIVGPGALALFYQRQVMVEFDRDILLQADIVAATTHFAPHLFGWDDSANVQAAEEAKSIHAINVTSN
jgi:hypothetical protein